jgi:hypothetical protein
MERNFINYSRNLLAYGIRAGMYSELLTLRPIYAYITHTFLVQLEWECC